MKKISTTYMFPKFYITINEEVKERISISDLWEANQGFLKHWGTPKQIIEELEEAIKAVKEIEKNILSNSN